MIAKQYQSSLLIIFILLLLGGAGYCLAQSWSAVTIESMESKTHDGHPVYNQIRYFPSKDRDVWTMKQSHNGAKAPLNEWDEVQIVVDKKTHPYQVSYHQLEKGQEVQFKATCYTCHANGPRVIRPNYGSKEIMINIKDRMVIAVMNLKIKMYGKTELKMSNFKLNGEFRTIPLKFFGKAATETLKVKTCTYCHKTDGWLARGELQKQHKNTIEHLTKSHQMPPWPFKLSQKEKKELSEFITDYK